MPRTEQPRKPLARIHPAVNCEFCLNKDSTNGVDSDLLFTTACPDFKMSNHNYCRERAHRVHWRVCAWRHYTNADSACATCNVGEGMVDIAHAIGLEIPE